MGFTRFCGHLVLFLWHFLLHIQNFRIFHELILLHRLAGSIGRRGRRMLSWMETLFSLNLTSLVAGRSEIFHLLFFNSKFSS